MKNLLGLFLLTLAVPLLAGNTLLLRGRVPASYDVVLNEEQKPIVKSNHADKHSLPKVTKTQGDKHITVTVIQP